MAQRVASWEAAPLTRNFYARFFDGRVWRLTINDTPSGVPARNATVLSARVLSAAKRLGIGLRLSVLTHRRILIQAINPKTALASRIEERLEAQEAKFVAACRLIEAQAVAKAAKAQERLEARLVAKEQRRVLKIQQRRVAREAAFDPEAELSSPLPSVDSF